MTTAADKLVTVAQLLRGGHTHAQVAEETGLTEDQIHDLARDIPGLKPPTAAPAVPSRLGQATPASTGVPQASLTRAITSASPPPQTLVTGTQPLTISRLLEEAGAHSNSHVRTAAAAIETRLDALRKLVKDLAADEHAKQQAAAETAKAKAEVARLEQQLKEAREKLKKTPSAKARTMTPEQKARAAANLAKARQPADCPHCGRTFGHAGALGNHIRTCTGPAA